MNFQTVGTLLLLGALVYLWLTVNRLSQAVRLLEQRALPPAPARPAPAFAAPPVEEVIDAGIQP